MRKFWKWPKLLLLLAICTVIFNEFLVYYVVLFVCEWPPKQPNDRNTLNAMILADTHLLGPKRGHWIDKLRREWQMHRAFQTAMAYFSPEVVIILGDLFDEGEFVNYQEFNEYIERFHRLFSTPLGTRILSVVGNHDIGFHYKLHPYFIQRFEEHFNNTGVQLYNVKDINFVIINSMAMEGDGCSFCTSAKNQMSLIADRLRCAEVPEMCKGRTRPEFRYSQPVLLQHFPSYRKSDESCIEHDSPKVEIYREKWEVLSKDATRMIGKDLRPRVVFGGHSHHYCKLKNSLNIEEFTVPSFSWRNKNDPRFLLTTFTPSHYAVSSCLMPRESTVLAIYFMASTVILFLLIFNLIRLRKHSFRSKTR